MSVLLAAAPAAGSLPADVDKDEAPSGWGEEAVIVSHGVAEQSKKGEDFWIAKCNVERAPGQTFNVYGIFDGHNGHQASAFSREHLLNFVLNAIPSGLSRDDWLASLPRALVIGFLKADTEFNLVERRAGTTATLVVVEGSTVTVASVGDSRCILDMPGGKPVALTVDHRLETNREEVHRVAASGGEIGRLETPDGLEVGPLRVWPGGLCLSRSIGDKDVGDYIVPVPHVKQIRLPPQGGRLILASDGVWDAVNNERAAKSCRGQGPNQAAAQVIKEALRARGLRDDTTCLVIDVMPRHDMVPPAPLKKASALKRMFSSSKRRGASTGDLQGMQEIFEATGADFFERLGRGMETSVHAGGSILCSICKTDLTPGGVSVHAGSIFAAGPIPWQGPFICANCKREAQGGGAGSPPTPARVVSTGTMLAETIEEELAASEGPVEQIARPPTMARTPEAGGGHYHQKQKEDLELSPGENGDR
ncbi:Putative protein phosphatase 2C family protein [Klebsormidium nitens]|uniref:PPM-type phosphatase domain-containing protein n=1 Tax=Klebsormidium nitens TaxID=105231 RepID=A0A1Y1ILB8_KLENI|nr:Putative protein phosphatase 2C family protein [Klebsormidium nitens]|eukprot:GAQ91594.1 Putative protein phosphatase 2C family protein [Klebsormidium nitens]